MPASIAQPLIEGLRNEVVVRDPRPAEAFGIVALTRQPCDGLSSLVGRDSRRGRAVVSAAAYRPSQERAFT